MLMEVTTDHNIIHLLHRHISFALFRVSSHDGREDTRDAIPTFELVAVRHEVGGIINVKETICTVRNLKVKPIISSIVPSKKLIEKPFEVIVDFVLEPWLLIEPAVIPRYRIDEHLTKVSC
jgi:hypothetical protein